MSAQNDEHERVWRHADGSVRVDHMDARPGDYYGFADGSTCRGWAESDLEHLHHLAVNDTLRSALTTESQEV